jgi:hypothetical protein
LGKTESGFKGLNKSSGRWLKSGKEAVIGQLKAAQKVTRVTTYYKP